MIFKFTPIHASVIYQILLIHRISVQFRENSSVYDQTALILIRSEVIVCRQMLLRSTLVPIGGARSLII